jgi:hypothetical protein
MAKEFGVLRKVNRQFSGTTIIVHACLYHRNPDPRHRRISVWLDSG